MKKLFFVPLIFLCATVFGQYNFTSLEQVLKEKQNVLGGNVSMIIYKGGKIVFEKHLGKYNSNTVEQIASCSKWFTAAMVMTYVEEGKLSLNDTLGKFLPVFGKNKKGKITIAQCLSHTTGIQGEEITLATLMNRNKYKTLEEEVNSFAAKPMSAKPGDQFYYGNIGLNIVGRVMEVISGKDFETLFQERIARPLEMKSTTFKNEHAINPSGGSVSSPSDYMNFLTMILNHGTFKGKKLLKETSVEKMQENFTEDVKVAFYPDQAEGMDYGLGEWILEKDDDDNPSVVGSPGLFGTFPYVDLVNNYAAILFVKNIRVKDRRLTYQEIKKSADIGLGIK